MLPLLFLLPPIYGILVIVLDTQTPPYRRSIRALGGVFLSKAAIAVFIICLGIFLEGRHPLTLLMIGVPVLAVVRIMQLERR